ncbi:lytic transglycosylase domain-containing protein [Qipengyuania sp. JC766]|uniref:lytic transglycosylase domain-containing protein n=1 Tax=Qipengyuania sp. JC766 TaxID=3232139 RepID=UPI00345852C1
MKTMRIAMALAAAPLALTILAPAASADTAAQYFRDRMQSPSVPEVLTDEEEAFYRLVFQALDNGSWDEARRLLDSRPAGALHQVAWAELYLDPNSPATQAEDIRKWFSAGGELPQAEQLQSLGAKRGLVASYNTPRAQNFVSQPYASKRILPRPSRDGTMPDSISNAILDRIKNDDPDGARVLLDGIDATLGSEARAEWRQRVAWSYYIENYDAAALAMAQTVKAGSGPWVAEGDWVAGLAAWRLDDCETASAAFERSAMGAENVELMAAARYWAARAHTRCRRPEKVAEQLRGAALADQTLYGMLAREQLGQELSDENRPVDFTQDDWRQLQGQSNVRAAIALNQIGEDGLADEVLRHQARIGDPSQYQALSRLARELGLPSTQLWMAHNAPVGTSSEPTLRYPAPRWEPVNGWQVDPALAYAHALQESNFRAAVVSPAGARGLMQIMPAAARDHQGRLGITGTARNLSKPAVNLAFGQEHLNMLRSSHQTEGKLPKIMAAYNAGLSPIGRWNSEVRDMDDPLLYMESIPYWETRGYVAIVMRNYWMYQRQAKARSASRRALAEGQWPQFPSMSPVRTAQAE